MVPAIAGILVAAWQYKTGEVDVNVLPFFGVLVALWCMLFIYPSFVLVNTKCVALACYLVLDNRIATTFLEYWKRQEAEWRCQWGMANYQEKEVERPQFVGEDIRNPIDGKMTKHFPYDIITYLLC
jgi:hypothetical protein